MDDIEIELAAVLREARAASASDELQDLHAAIMAVNAAERQIN